MENFYLNRNSDLENEYQIDVSERANTSGLLMPVFVTSNIWQELIKPDEEAVKRGESENVRLSQLLSQLVTAIRISRQTQKTNLINFNASYTKNGKSENYEVFSYLGPLNKENKKPCITLFVSQDIDEESDT